MFPASISMAWRSYSRLGRREHPACNSKRVSRLFSTKTSLSLVAGEGQPLRCTIIGLVVLKEPSQKLGGKEDLDE